MKALLVYKERIMDKQDKEDAVTAERVLCPLILRVSVCLCICSSFRK